MRQYEVIFILRPDLDEEKNQAVIDKFKGIVEADGGEITKLDKWGKRRLAYEVKDLREGFYVVMQVKASPAIVNELDRVFKITDEVLRHMIVKEEE
ncbi:MAG: 30S ribosomal protein S6 [Firmicutes bacterium]|nr:30S ribosomal protein S6 [Bacillota bacterium]